MNNTPCYLLRLIETTDLCVTLTLKYSPLLSQDPEAIAQNQAHHYRDKHAKVAQDPHTH